MSCNGSPANPSPTPSARRAAWNRQIRTPPPASAVRWVERSLGVSVLSHRVLTGGSSSAMHRLRVASPGGAVESVVLRRYVIASLNEEEPDLAEREARVLRLLERCEVATPELLAVDETGEEAGVPSVVMSSVRGRAGWVPLEGDEWLRKMARVLPMVHVTPLPDGHRVGDFEPYNPASWDPPRCLTQPNLWDRAVEVFHGPVLDGARVLVHRDYHRGNVLWRRGRVSGVVDWQSTSVGPPSVDVAYCHSDLIGPLGLAAADRFVAMWEAESGESYHPWAHIVLLVDALAWPHPRSPRECAELEGALARALAMLGA